MKSRREMVLGFAGAGALLVAASARAQSALTVTVSPTIISGTGSGGSDYATAMVSGGVAPYTYQWVRISGSAYIEASNPANAATDFYWTGPFSGPPRLSAWECHVTDATSAVASSGSIHVAFDPTA